jgi:hypothetical protein
MRMDRGENSDTDIVGSRRILCGMLAVIDEEIKALKWKLWHAICALEKIIVDMDELGRQGDFPAARLNSLGQQLLTYTILRKRRKSTVYLAEQTGFEPKHALYMHRFCPTKKASEIASARSGGFAAGAGRRGCSEPKVELARSPLIVIDAEPLLRGSEEEALK